MRVSFVLDCTSPRGLVPFWTAALRYEVVFEGGDVDPDQYVVLRPAAGEPAGPVLILQKVPEPRAGKNRAHVDVHAPDLEAHVGLLVSLGGSAVGEPIAEVGHRWQRVTDPEGNELCVVDASSPAAT